MRMLTVTTQSNLSEVSRSLAQFLRVDSLVAVEAQGDDAVSQLLQTLAQLRQLWQSEPYDLAFITEVETDGESDTDEPYLRITLATSPFAEGELSAAEQMIDEEIKKQFDAWQVLPDDNNELLEKIRQHHSESPVLSGGDVDAAWDQADDVGEEAAGDSTPTPDQDVVDELGEAVGLTYEDDEPLHSGDKLQERDKHRWELDPASQDDEESAP